MTITVQGPDGATVEFPDGTDSGTISAVMTKSFGTAKPDVPVTVNSVVRSAATGVPGGGVLNKANAATNAALAPVLNPLFNKEDQLQQPTFGGRYDESLRQQRKMDKDFSEAHPIVDTAAQLTGGIASLGGAAAASPAVASALGMTGKLIPAATKGALSGAAIGAGDAALRDGAGIKEGAEIGALTGAGGVVAGKAIGKVWDAAARAWRPAPEPIPTRTMDVNGVEVPVRESVVTGDPSASQIEQKAFHGGMGDEAQRIARQHAEETEAAMARAHDQMSASLDPTGQVPRTTPQAAGENVAQQLASAEERRAAAETQRLRGITSDTDNIRTELAPPTGPAAGTVVAETPRTAAQVVSEGLRGGAARMAAARDSAYEAIKSVEGEFSPAAFQRIGNSIRARLNAGSDPVIISDTRTPYSADALRDLETNVGQLRFENQASPPNRFGPDGRPMAPAITAETIDEARKRLISMQRDANSAARTSGDFSDVRAMRRIVSAFDDHVEQAARSGGFSGDADQLIQRLGNARSLHAELKRTYGPRNPQDDVGKAIEKIVGKRDVAPAELETVAPMLFGSSAEPGGALSVRIAQRIADIHGHDSAQFAALRQGLLSHMVDTPAGIEPLSNEVIANRIHRFFNGTKGAGLAQELFTPSERARLLTHANRMRTAVDPAPEGQVEKMIAKWSGRDGGQRASAKTVVDTLMGESGKNGMSPLIVESLRTKLTPDGMTAIKQGVWSRVTEDADGAIKWGDQKVGQRIMKFLNGDGKGLADALFTPAERTAMERIADAHLKNIPVPGTTNPSGSGHLISRLAHGARHSMLPIVGFSHGGLPGAALGTALDKAVTIVGNKRSAKEAARLFYGPQVSQKKTVMAPQRFGALGGNAAAVNRQSR